MPTKVSTKRLASVNGVSRDRTTHRNESAVDIVRNIAEQMERMPAETWDGIPTDVSKNVDHYLYGSPKRD